MNSSLKSPGIHPVRVSMSLMAISGSVTRSRIRLVIYSQNEASRPKSPQGIRETPEARPPPAASGTLRNSGRVPQVALFYLGVGLYGRGISSCLQMARTVPSLISRWRWTLAILCKVGLNQMLWAPPSRYKTQPSWRRWRSNSASFMLPLFQKPRAQRVGKDLFPQVRAGIAAPASARLQDSL